MLASKNPVVANALATGEKGKGSIKPIIIHPSPTADTRTADHDVSKEELLESSKQHIRDVRRGLDRIAEMIQDRGSRHDWTKIAYIDSFYNQFRQAQQSGVWSKHSGWYSNIHTRLERHHLEDTRLKGVNLFDVFEHIVDCVMAGKARSGSFICDTLPSGMLELAYKNTQELVAAMVEVKN